MDNIILSVKNLNVTFAEQTGSVFSKRKEHSVLKDVSFSVKEGEILGLLGESGCGKSTLAKTILGLNKQYSGEILTSVTYPQMVFQDPYGSLNPSRTIRFHLMEPLKMRTNMSRAEMEERSVEMIQKVGLTPEFLDRYPAELSGGQRQRICIAQALMVQPQILIADEPVSALDVTIQAQILELLSSLHKEMGLTILFISHDLRVVYQICDRVMVMKSGQIVESGPVDEVYFSPKEEYTKQLLSSAGI
ncbi:MAG: ATP-binding cassette domain-containing protein [Lachnospiraceae bacterium]|nr:ATP-binding cassette domain-containing protein [Lachnospiraceae bacterium]